jgi:hydrogenase-4 component B
MERLGGLAKVMPANASLFVLASMGICALPPFNGLISEWLIYTGLFTAAGGAGGRFAAACGVVGLTALGVIGGLALASFARAIGVVFLGAPRDATIQPHPTPRLMLGGLLIPAIGCAFIGLFPVAIIRLLRNALGPLVEAGLAELHGAVAPLASVSLLVAIFLCTILVLIALRERLRYREEDHRRSGTWGCGYAFPTPRMQYTGSSFAASLMHLAREALRTRRRQRSPQGYFPRMADLSTSTPDVALTNGFEPLFTRLARFFQSFWPLQHGRIQLYLIYIAAALVLAFVIEFTVRPGSRQPLHQPPIASLEVKP